MPRLQIQTPEGIIFSLTLAGPIPRFLAWLVDLFCIMVIATFINKIIGILGNFVPDFASALDCVPTCQPRLPGLTGGFHHLPYLLLFLLQLLHELLGLWVLLFHGSEGGVP